VIATRDWFSQSLTELGFEVLPSSTNFVFASHPDQQAAQLFTKLREQKILVRYFEKPRLDKHLRISIGTDAEMRQCIEALRQIITS